MLSTPQEGWTCITLNASGEIERLGDILRAAWDSQEAICTRNPESGAEADSPSADGNGALVELEPSIAAGDPSSEPLVR